MPIQTRLEMREQPVTGCQEQCRRIDEKPAFGSRCPARAGLLRKSALYGSRAREPVPRECKLFYEVSRSMPPEQGQRYLSWMHQRNPDGPTDQHH
jgi:hypothetical protein